MADVGKVYREKGPEPGGPKKKKELDPEEFQKWMEQKKKIRETDPEQQRRRKTQAEYEEEFKAEQAAGGPPKQGLEPKPSEEPSPYAPSEGTGPKMAGKAPLPPPSGPEEQPPYFQPPPTEGPPPPRRKETPRPEGQQPTQKPPEEKQKVEKKKKTKATGAVPETKKAKPAEPTAAPKGKGVEEVKGKETEAFFKQLAKPEKEPPKKEKEKKAEEAVPALPEGAWEGAKAPEKKTKEKETEEPIPTIQPETQVPTPTPTGQPTTPLTPLSSAFAHLPPQIQQVFERMVGVMTVMHESGIKETTINLDNPQFKNSVFFGAQITITEFSTAPKQYNIELLGNQQAINLFAANSEELVAAFQGGNYNFKVNRIDTSYMPAVKEAKRKAKRVKRKKT